MGKITINMLSKAADSIKGQGVGSAYLEQVKLVTEGASDIFDVKINDIHDADILHHHTVEPMNYLRMKTSKGINVSYVHFLPETLDGSINLPKPAFDIFKKYVIDFYKSADYLIVVNPIFISDLEKYGIPRNRIKYIPNYVSKVDFYKKSSKEKKEIRKNLNIDPKAFVVIGVGQVQTRKGVIDFVNVATKLPEVTFIWCGGFSFGNITDGYKELKEVVDNPPANVKFVGIIPREKMNDMYNAADVLFMPSYNELFPMSILEASNVEIPILLRDLDLYKDILFGNYMIGKNNDEFSSSIKLLMENKDKYDDYCKKSHNINQFYSKDNVLKIWRDFYSDIYNKHESKHLVFLSKTSKELDKIVAGKKTAIIRGGTNKRATYVRAKRDDTLYFVDKSSGYIECKAIVEEAINTEKLSKEEALDLILKYQKELLFTAAQIKRWASKKYITLIRFKNIEVVEPFKIYECDYINMDDWLTIENKKLD